MSRNIKFPELQDVLVATGLTINGISKITKVSRNTLAAMRDGQDVSANSVIKLLNNLESKVGVDVRDFRATLQRRMASLNEVKKTVGGGPMLAVDNTVNDYLGRRTSINIAADLRAHMKTCAELASELAEAADNDDLDVKHDDPRHIMRYHKRLKADLDEVFFKFRDLIPEQSDEKPRE